METVAIVANGQIDSPDLLRPLILRHSRIVAVDGGLLHCHRMSIEPHLIVGDFDSCSADLLAKYKKIPHLSLPVDKDETDLEVALKHEKGAKITLYGAWGGRIDHSLTNALLLSRFPGQVEMETETELVFALEGTVHLRCFIGQTLSLIPLNGPAKGMHSKGLKWELRETTLDQNWIGISNICLKEEIEISVETGSVLCCLNKR